MPKRWRPLRASPLSTAGTGPMEPAGLMGTMAANGAIKRHIEALQVAGIISCVNDERSERLALADPGFLQERLDRVYTGGRYG